MSININSEASCRKAYINYHCHGNTMGISAKEMGKITAAWESKIYSWQNSVSNDENEYEFDDSEYRTFKEKGKEKAKEEAGNITKGDINVSGVRAAGDAIAAAGTTVLGLGVGKGLAGAIGGEAIKKAAKKAGEKAAEKVGEEAAKEAAKQAASNKVTDAAGNIAWMISAPLALATGVAYAAKKPNKEEVEAAKEMNNLLANAQGKLGDTQSEMEDMSEALIELSDEANEANEEANGEMIEQKSEFDMYRQSLEALKAKAQSGQPLTPEEQAFYRKLVGLVGETADNINTKSEDTTELVQDIYGDMETYQEGYDYAAETIAEVQGMTEYAASFDKATETMCYVEMAAQGLNAASGGKAAFNAGKFAASGGIFTAWAWTFVAMGGTGAVLSGAGALEQGKFAKEVGNEINTRGVTEELNTATNEIYTEEIDVYDGLLTGVEDLEMEVPKDTEVPTDTNLPTTNTKEGKAKTNTSLGLGGVNKKEKEEK